MSMRNIDESLRSRLRIRATQHGKSMEEDARDVLRTAPSAEAQTGGDLGAAIRSRFAALGGGDLAVSRREPMRETVGFDS
jgi:plasmid stability protein